MLYRAMQTTHVRSITILSLVALGLLGDLVQADPRPRVEARPVTDLEWTPAAREAIARVAELETANPNDWPAIAGVLVRRYRMTRRAQRWDLAGQTIAYSHLLGAWGGHCRQRRPWSPRMRRILTRPGPRVYGMIDAWARGAWQDPCPTAIHWGAQRLGSPLPVARCFIPHWELSNRFRDPAGS